MPSAVMSWYKLDSNATLALMWSVYMKEHNETE